jgi:hypothetical protein
MLKQTVRLSLFGSGGLQFQITLLAKVLSKPEIVPKIEIDSAKNKEV